MVIEDGFLKYASNVLSFKAHKWRVPSKSALIYPQ